MRINIILLNELNTEFIVLSAYLLDCELCLMNKCCSKIHNETIAAVDMGVVSGATCLTPGRVSDDVL